MDEAKGRTVAELYRLNVRGTIGVLEQAARENRIDIADALRRFFDTNFRISHKLRTLIAQKHRVYEQIM